jgi:hypothetical protein
MYTVNSFIGSRYGTGTTSGAKTLELARERAWKDVTYFATDIQTGYGNTGYAIDLVCDRCQGNGIIHRNKRLKACSSAYHKMFSPKCYVTCPECKGDPIKPVESSIIA